MEERQWWCWADRMELILWRPEGQGEGEVTGTLKERAALKGAVTFSGRSSQASVLNFCLAGREPRNESTDLFPLPPPSCDLLWAAPLAANQTTEAAH